MTLQTRLSALLQAMRDEQLGFPGRLSSAEQSARGTFEAWSAKDVLAHNGVWLASKLSELRQVDRGEPLVERDDAAEDRANQASYDAHQDSSWEDVLALITEGYTNIGAYIQAAGEERLADISEVWGQPLWREIAGTYITHPHIHMWEYLDQHGHQDTIVERFGPAFAAQLIALDADPSWQGTVTYNLACQYALLGDDDAALENLARALQLTPELREWAQQDSDLDALRDKPAYAALFT